MNIEHYIQQAKATLDAAKDVAAYFVAPVAVTVADKVVTPATPSTTLHGISLAQWQSVAAIGSYVIVGICTIIATRRKGRKKKRDETGD